MPSALRLVVLRVGAVLCALGWLVFPGFGVPDLLVTWDPDWPVVLEAGWGLLSGVLLATAFLRLAVAPRRSAAALVQLWTVTTALAVAVPAAGELPALLLAGLALGETALVTVLHGAPHPPRPDPWTPLLAVAGAGAAGWVAYAVAQFGEARAGVPVDVTVGVDHSAVQGALALALAALALVAALWPGGRRYLGVGAGAAAGYLGLVSLAWPGTPGGMGGAWSVLATAWGLAVAGLSALGPREAPREAPGEGPGEGHGAADLRRGPAASGPGRRRPGWGA